MRTIEELRNIPFFKLTNEEKKALIAATDDQVKTAETGRDAAIARMAASIMRKAR